MKKSEMKECSFCGRDKSEALLLVSGIEGNICEICIDQAVEIKNDELPSHIQFRSVKDFEELESELKRLKDGNSITSEPVATLQDTILQEAKEFISYLQSERIIEKIDKEIDFKKLLKIIKSLKIRERKYFAEICLEKISNAEIKDVIKLIMQYSQENENEELRKEIIHLSSKWNSLSKDVRKGILKLEDANIEQNKINAALLDLIEQIETH